MQAKLKEIKKELRRRMHQPIPEQGQMAGASRQRLLCLPCRPDQRAVTWCIPPPHSAPLGEVAPATKPKGSLRMAEGREASQRLAPQTQDPSPLASGAVCRQTLKVGAQCGSAARWELSGGRGVTRVPTGIIGGAWLSPTIAPHQRHERITRLILSQYRVPIEPESSLFIHHQGCSATVDKEFHALMRIETCHTRNKQE